MKKRTKCGSGRPSYDVVSNQLSNEELRLALLREAEDRERKGLVRIFPKEAKIDRLGRLIDPRQFIISGTGRDIDRFTAGKRFWLQPTSSVLSRTDRVHVQVMKSNRPSPKGKRYVLLQTISDSLASASTSVEDFDTTDVHVFDGKSSTQVLGIIHPGNSNENGGKGHSGEASCYGTSLLVTPRPGTEPDPLAEVRAVAQIATYEQDAALGTATVAVLDSGIWFDEHIDADRRTTCSDISWDFATEPPVDGDPFPEDDHPGLHGTKICTIIKHTAPGVGILPVKISKPNGALTLYDALCGLEFARTHGAKVVNASWSFTASDSSNQGETHYPLLLQAIRDLEDSGIVVVAAAGNRNQYPSNANGHIGKGSGPLIYPACYADFQDNVITVTTVLAPGKNGHFTAFENFSNEFVDTGALANATAPEPAGNFKIPGFLNSYRGSSFATPYVAAKIAQVISTTPGYVSKRALLRRLREFFIEDDLTDETRYGGCYVKV